LENGRRRLSLPFRLSDSEVRQMYAENRGNASTGRYARFWSAWFSMGLAPRRWVTLEVLGRKSGRLTRFPLGMADYEGEWSFVSMLGEECNWVQNVRAADGQVVVRHGRSHRRRLVEGPVERRAAIIRRYVQRVPGGRPHIPIDRSADLGEFEAVAAGFPVFAVRPVAARHPAERSSGLSTAAFAGVPPGG